MRYTTVVTATRAHTIYAHWRSLGNSLTVTFNANGGSVSPTTRKVASGAAVGGLPTPSRTGYMFAGWWTAPNGGAQVFATTRVVSSVTYYAHWTPLAGGGISQPWTAQKAVTLDGAVYDAKDEL